MSGAALEDPWEVRSTGDTVYDRLAAIERGLHAAGYLPEAEAWGAGWPAWARQAYYAVDGQYEVAAVRVAVEDQAFRSTLEAAHQLGGYAAVADVIYARLGYPT